MRSSAVLKITADTVYRRTPRQTDRLEWISNVVGARPDGRVRNSWLLALRVNPHRSRAYLFIVLGELARQDGLLQDCRRISRNRMSYPMRYQLLVPVARTALRPVARLHHPAEPTRSGRVEFCNSIADRASPQRIVHLSPRSRLHCLRFLTAR